MVCDLIVIFECLVVKMGHLVVILTDLVVKITGLVVFVNNKICRHNQKGIFAKPKSIKKVFTKRIN